MLGLLVMRWKKTNYYKPYKVMLTSRDLDWTKKSISLNCVR